MVGTSSTEVTEDSVVALRCFVSGCGMPDLLKLALLPVLGFGTAEPRDEEYRCQCQVSCFWPFLYHRIPLTKAGDGALSTNTPVSAIYEERVIKNLLVLLI